MGWYDDKLPLFRQVKRQAVVEIQRAAAAAEMKSLEMITSERLKMEKLLLEFNRTNNEHTDVERSSPAGQPSQNVSLSYFGDRNFFELNNFYLNSFLGVLELWT